MTDVAATFTDISESQMVTNQHAFNLSSYHQENVKRFINQLEGCYLKIVKNFTSLSKQQRRLFELTTEKLFTQIRSEQTTKHFLKFFGEGLESSQFLTRVCCGRHLFMMLRVVNVQLSQLCDEKTATDLLQNTVGLFRQGKGSKNGKTERALAVKLGAYLQHISIDLPRVRQAKQALMSEMIRTLCEEDRKDLRLDALTNIELSQDTLQYVILRIRDTDISVRLQVLKKLIKAKLSFADMALCDIYQLIHDGLKNSSNEVRKQTQVLILNQFQLVRDMVQSQSVMVEELPQKKSIARKRVSIIPSDDNEIENAKRLIQTFIGYFKVENTLLHPSLYEVVVDTVKVLFSQRETSDIALYLRDLFSHRMASLSPVNPDELFFARVALLKSSEIDVQIAESVDAHFLDGCQLSDYIENRLTATNSLLELYELLGMASQLINCDQAGREKLILILKKLVFNPRDLRAPRGYEDRYNEIYEHLTENEIESRWFGQHHYEHPIIRDYMDLILPAMKVLSQLQDPHTFLKQTIDVIGTIRAVLTGEQEDIEEGNLIQHRRSLELKIKVQEEQKEDQLNRLKDMRQSKRKNNQQLSILEQLNQETVQYITQLQQQLNKLDKRIAEVDTHALYMVNSVFQLVDVQLGNELQLTKLRDMVFQLNKQYHENGSFKLPKQLGLKCLSFVPLLDFEQCQRILNIFVNILQASLNVSSTLNSDDPTLIIAIRCVLDCMLLYNFNEFDEFGSGENVYEKHDIINIVANIALKGRGTLQCTALEGLCKLLLHSKIDRPQVYVGFLLFIWFDKSIKEQHLQLQIVTTFFKCFITSSADLLLVFQEGLSIYTCICCFLNTKPNLKFNPVYLQSGHWQEGHLIANTQVGLKMMQFRTINTQNSHSQLKERLQNCPQTAENIFLGPQEHFIIFLCKMIAEYNSLILRTLLTPGEYDFFAHYEVSGDNENKITVEPRLLEIVIRYLQATKDNLTEKGKDTKNETALLKPIFELLGTEILSEKSNECLTSINMKFDDLKQNVNQLVKFLKEDKIIIEDTKGLRDRDIGQDAPILKPQETDESAEEQPQQQPQQPQKRNKMKGETDEEEESSSIPARKKAIQKKRVGKKKI